ncbi:MAG: deoxyribodipyrimidine photo-lyase/cryptochrome family protein [Serpentinimonas sp.]|nr:MAG: hypothetical protein JM57_11375 [Comamonadaceae bacterium BICA1-1]MDO8274918.1 deoxyribodipyrimidine photo-lyase/cryptochrome family protein [Serpentinimonas sp.]MDO9612239.1 deoxyribodipyrimidine photo-lyase/cryptochrome family protein [Serpentinimonas sp.]
MACHVLWFKRDLRLHDHAALVHAAQCAAADGSPVLCLYALEPSLWAQPDAAALHYAFLRECLQDLQQELQAQGGDLLLWVGEVLPALDWLQQRVGVAALHTHQETGNAHTYARDRAVARWCRTHRVPWHEQVQFGVLRPLRQRSQWLPHWQTQMARPTLPLPTQVRWASAWGLVQKGAGEALGLATDYATFRVADLPPASAFGLDPWVAPLRQRGGRQQALQDWERFAHSGSAAYRGGISEALMQGRTGWPMVDACVAMLRQTGWLNFRMRAMLVSVAAYPLWLHWREVGLWLARHFLDYEPGIHWSQMQMQAGTTGINATRVYNPVKQAQDHDPQGQFVRHWLPAMRRVPDAWLFEPWRMPHSVQAHCGVQVGVDLALPLVELQAATRSAKARLHARRAQPEVRAAKAAIVERHGSRKAPFARKGGSPAAAQGSVQGSAQRSAHAAPSSGPQQMALDF